MIVFYFLFFFFLFTGNTRFKSEKICFVFLLKIKKILTVAIFKTKNKKIAINNILICYHGNCEIGYYLIVITSNRRRQQKKSNHGRLYPFTILPWHFLDPGVFLNRMDYSRVLCFFLCDIYDIQRLLRYFGEYYS